MKVERFRVVTVDEDGSVQLDNLDMKKRGIRNTLIWCESEIALRVGQVIFGSFNFDPSQALMMGRFPTFKPASSVEPGPFAA